MAGKIKRARESVRNYKRLIRHAQALIETRDALKKLHANVQLESSRLAIEYANHAIYENALETERARIKHQEEYSLCVTTVAIFIETFWGKP